jgi:hypothetical protein
MPHRVIGRVNIASAADDDDEEDDLPQDTPARVTIRECTALCLELDVGKGVGGARACGA